VRGICISELDSSDLGRKSLLSLHSLVAPSYKLLVLIKSYVWLKTRIRKTGNKDEILSGQTFVIV